MNGAHAGVDLLAKGAIHMSNKTPFLARFTRPPYGEKGATKSTELAFRRSTIYTKVARETTDDQ